MVYEAVAGSGSGKSIQGDCEKPKYYKLTNTGKKKINFVFSAINKSTEIGKMPDNKIPNGTTMEITENFGYYYLEVNDWSTHSNYKVNKS